MPGVRYLLSMVMTWEQDGEEAARPVTTIWGFQVLIYLDINPIYNIAKIRLACAGLFWPVMACSGLYWYVLDCAGLCWTVLAYSSWPALVWLSLYWPGMGLSGLVRSACPGCLEISQAGHGSP